MNKTVFLFAFLLLALLALSAQQEISSDTSYDKSAEDDTLDEDVEELEEIMKEMEELAKNEASEDIFEEAPVVETPIETAPKEPPSYSSYKQSRHESTDDSSQRKGAGLEYLRSRRSTKGSGKGGKGGKRSKKQKASSSTAGGAYYGGEIDQEKKDAYRRKQQEQQQQRAKKSSDSAASSSGSGYRGKMASMSDSLFLDLENRLSERVRVNVAYAEHQSAERSRALARRHERARLPRRIAAPVEEILRIYDDVHTDLYDVLGVKRNIDEATLKKKYRAKALAVHPDKNPHPDAKAAFDALQDAYDTLAHPTKRLDYDAERQRIQRQHSRRWHPRNLKRQLKEHWNNVRAQWLVMWYQWRRGETIEELVQWRDRCMIWLEQGQHFLEHLCLLPTVWDRVLLVHEVVWRRRGVFMVVLAITVGQIWSSWTSSAARAGAVDASALF